MLLVSITREIDPHNVQGTTSFTVFSVLFDAIQCEILRRKGSDADAFAEFIRGSCGERLGSEVGDISLRLFKIVYKMRQTPERCLIFVFILIQR